MTDETPRPKLKRRRWLIAGVLSFVVTITGWWIWPRGDARFVGTWDFHYSEDVSGGGAFVFRGNETGHFVSHDGRRNLSFAWHASTDVFSMGANAEGNTATILNAVAETLWSWTGRSFCPERTDYQILSISPAQIEITEPDGVGRLIFKRRFIK